MQRRPIKASTQVAWHSLKMRLNSLYACKILFLIYCVYSIRKKLANFTITNFY